MIISVIVDFQYFSLENYFLQILQQILFHHYVDGKSLSNQDGISFACYINNHRHTHICMHIPVSTLSVVLIFNLIIRMTSFKESNKINAMSKTYSLNYNFKHLHSTCLTFYNIIIICNKSFRNEYILPSYFSS